MNYTTSIHLINSSRTDFTNTTLKPDDGNGSLNIGMEKTVIILIFAVLSFLQNSFLLIAILTNHRLRKKVTFVFVINLLFSQTLVAAVTLPMYCYAPTHFIFGYILALTILAYILNLCTVTVERYLAICRPYAYVRHVSVSRTIKASLSCWLISFIIQLLPIFWKGIENEKLAHRVYVAFTLFFFIIIPLFVVWFSNGFICLEIIKMKKNEQCGVGKLGNETSTNEETSSLSGNMVSSTQFSKGGVNRSSKYNNSRNCRRGFIGKNNNNNIIDSNKRTASHRQSSSKFRQKLQRSHKEIQLTMVFVIAAIAYNITWIPVIIMNFLEVIDRMDLEPAHLSEISVFLLALNANLDPLIYGLFLRPLRNHLAKSTARFCRSFFCCESNPSYHSPNYEKSIEL